jgi:hypothetical protein
MVAMAYPCVPIEPQQQQGDDNCVCQNNDKALVGTVWSIEAVMNGTAANIIVVATNNDVVAPRHQ